MGVHDMDRVEMAMGVDRQFRWERRNTAGEVVEAGDPTDDRDVAANDAKDRFGKDEEVRLAIE